MSDPTGRILGIDYGTRRIGLAVSDPMGVLASGRGTVENSPAFPALVDRMIQEEQINLVVVGMPYAPDGGLGMRGAAVREFVARLKSVVSVPVETWDESYSSVKAHEAFRAGGMKKGRRQEKGRVDEMAARIMLQEFLDHRPGVRVGGGLA